MPFKLSKYEDEFIDNCLNQSIDELDKLFNLRLKDNQRPSIITINSRKEIDEFRGEITPKWLIGWISGGNVIVLNNKTFTENTDNKYSDEYYRALIKHELIHIFVSKFSSGKKPEWLHEGIAIYLSGQLKTRKQVSVFSNFLNYYSNINDEIGNVYQESGFVVEKLYNKFGLNKIIELLKVRDICKNEDDFKDKFKQIYDFELNYVNINKL